MIAFGVLLMVAGGLCLLAAINQVGGGGCLVITALALIVFVGPCMILAGLLENSCEETYYGSCE